jgi:uncharacterized protein
MKFHLTVVNNKNKSMRAFRFIAVFLLISFSLSGQYLPEPMVPLRLVNDFTGMLTEQEQIDLNNKLLTFNNETSTQIYVVTYDSLQGYDIADYGDRLGQKWGIGQQGRDNGILVLISPASHLLTIRTGYGLEGAVPDAICFRLIETVIKPGFREGNFYSGLDSATNVLMSLTRGEFTADDYLKKSDSSKPVIIFLLIALFLFVFFISSARQKYYSPKHTIPWWMLMGTGSSKDGGWGSFTSGGGGFGGGGGGFGGFGGGGGGSFGGGGASGGW